MQYIKKNVRTFVVELLRNALRKAHMLHGSSFLSDVFTTG